MNQTWNALRQDAVPLLKTTWQEFGKHHSQWLAAALAYFAAFAIAPLIIVLVEIAGLFLGSHHQTLNMIYTYMQRDAGAGAAGAIKAIVSATFNQQRKGALAQIIGWVIFFVAAIGLFSAVQFALNNVWDVEPKKMGWKETLKERGVAFAVMLGIVALMMLSMFANTALTVAGHYLGHLFPGLGTLLKVADFVLSFGVIWLAFAVLFEYLPDCRIEWRDVWVGAGLTSLLFVSGQFLLGWYLGRAGVTSAFGAFGALIIFLIWVNYSSQIMLFGAEFTRAYARRHGAQQPRTSTHGELMSIDPLLSRPR
ncbi:MAG: YihY/virulence factor BrkB family protein [Candidatus Baltobacteraceae bacterium]